jgi:tight adherence protein C
MSQRVLILGYLSAIFFALALFTVAYVIASAPSSPSSPLGLRGLKRQRVLATNESWARIEPFIRWMGIRCSGIMTPGQRLELDTQLSLAGDWMGITPEEYLGMSILSGIAGALGGGLLGYLTGLGMLMFIILGLLGLVLPYMQISGAAQDRLKDVSRGLPYAIDLMALAMGAGLDFPGAIRQVVQKSSNPEDPMVEEFTLIMQSLNLGRSRKDALTEFARRAPVDAVKEFCGSLVQAEERGNPVADVLQIQATGSRTRRSVRAEELAAKAGVAMVGPLMLVFAAIMMLILGPMYLKLKSGGIGG